jgi:hypothetical protein
MSEPKPPSGFIPYTQSLRAAVAQQFGLRALTRLDEMLPVQRAALERHFNFLEDCSRNIQFLSAEHEQEVLAEALRSLVRPSKAEKSAILRTLGLNDRAI